MNTDSAESFRIESLERKVASLTKTVELQQLLITSLQQGNDIKTELIDVMNTRIDVLSARMDLRES